MTDGKRRMAATGQNRLSDGACIGGIFGSLGNLAILALVAVWAIILAVKSFRNAELHAGLKPLGTVALSSVIAISIGLNAALGCTV
ncbi:MAG: hypothetical protein AAFR35_15985 [Pseudomonadota bacterium]